MRRHCSLCLASPVSMPPAFETGDQHSRLPVNAFICPVSRISTAFNPPLIDKFADYETTEDCDLARLES